MSSAQFIGLLICAFIVGFWLTGKVRLYYFACAVFILGAISAASGLMDGIRGNHWEIRSGRYGKSWYQNIGVGVVLMGGAVYFARRDWSKTNESKSEPPEPSPGGDI